MNAAQCFCFTLCILIESAGGCEWHIWNVRHCGRGGGLQHSARYKWLLWYNELDHCNLVWLDWYNELDRCNLVWLDWYNELNHYLQSCVIWRSEMQTRRWRMGSLCVSQNPKTIPIKNKPNKTSTPSQWRDVFEMNMWILLPMIFAFCRKFTHILEVFF